MHPASALRRTAQILIAVLVVLILAVISFLVWAHIVMMGERGPAAAVWGSDTVTVTTTDHSIILEPVDAASDTGIVYIPGARVDPFAYMYKLSDIVEQAGITVVITEPTLNLAFFDTRPLSTWTSDAPDIEHWYVGGHSLGGVKACMLTDEADAPVDGLILFASYCAEDLSDSGLTVLSISASNDGLSTPEKIDAAAHLLPDDTQFVEIEGGNHGGFGDYGDQPGDGEATISSEEQRAAITEALELIFAER